MKAVLKQVQGLAFAGKADSGHWVMLDGPKQFGGAEAGTRPMELFLMGLGGCTSMDVVSILQKKKVKLDGFECHLDADRTDEHPTVFKNINIKFIFYGQDISESAVERAIELSETKYCSASAMLKKAVPINVEYEIKDAANTA